jgi:hypothetical protein
MTWHLESRKDNNNVTKKTKTREGRKEGKGESERIRDVPYTASGESLLNIRIFLQAEIFIL